MSSKDNAINLVLTVFILLLPFIFFLGITNPYEFPKFVLTIVVAQIIAVILFIKKTKLVITPLHKLILLFLAVTFVADLVGLDPKVSLFGSIYRHQGFVLLFAGYLLFLGTSILKGTKQIKKTFVLSALILALVTIIEYLGLKTGVYFPTYNGRVAATLGNPNFIASYLVVTLPFLLNLKIKNYLKVCFVFLLSIAVFITDSRSGQVALLFILGFVTIGNLRQNTKIVLIIPVLLLIVVNLNRISRNSYWDNRGLIWSEGIKAVASRPIFGYGQENFELAFPTRYNFKVDNAHNLFLETAISTGILGLLLYLGILFTAFKKAPNVIRLGITSFMVVGFFNPLSIPTIALFWIMLGMIEAKSTGSL